MPLTMNKESMKESLNKIIPENEKYITAFWATLPTITPKLFTYTAPFYKLTKIGSRNLYCYVGLTHTHINIVTLHSLDVTRSAGYFQIPLCEISHVTITNGILKGSALLDFNHEQLKINWVNQAAGTDIKNQRKNAKKFSDFFL